MGQRSSMRPPACRAKFSVSLLEGGGGQRIAKGPTCQADFSVSHHVDVRVLRELGGGPQTRPAAARAAAPGRSRALL